MRKTRYAFPVKIEVSFSFLAVLGFLICADRDGNAVLCLLACVLHEAGHLFVMIIERKLPSSVTFYGGGIHICGGSTSIAAVSAGVIANIVLFLIFGLIPWENEKLRLFGVINLLIAVFNLLPFGELDGKLMLDKALVRAFPAEKAIRCSDICSKVVLLFVLPAAVTLVFSGYLNFSAVTFFFFLLGVEILEKI